MCFWRCFQLGGELIHILIIKTHVLYSLYIILQPIQNKEGTTQHKH